MFNDPYSISLPKSFIGVELHWVDFGNWVLAPIFLVSIYWTAFSFITKLMGIKIDYRVVTSLFKETENEIGSEDDFNVLQSQVLGLIMFYLLLLKTLYMYPTWVASPMVVNTISLMVIVLALPATLSLLMGAYIMNYLKGDSNSNSVLYAGLFDLASLFGFFKRFSVQFIRYILITAKVALFYHFVLKSFKGGLLTCQFRSEKNINGGFVQTLLDSLNYYKIYAIEFIAELFNIFIVYYAQMGAFVIVLFWLLKALYASAWPIANTLWFLKKKKQ